MNFITRLIRSFALVAGFVMLGSAAHAACSNPNAPEGSLNYNHTAQRFEYCDDTNAWKALGSGVGTMVSLTDVSITNLAGRDYLRYDAGTSRWVNISESTVMSTTTMVPNWPDAIRCNEGSVDVILYRAAESSGTNYYVEPYSSGSDYMVAFNSSGSYVSQVTRDYNNCKTSIATISAAGRAFNFIGNAATSGGALGDRLTSGTLPYAVTVNSATGIISLSTAATTWGYLGSGASFLPAVAANKVSAAAVSGSIIQVGNTGASCTSGISGSIRYSSVSSTMEYCNSTAWVSLGPSDTQVISFAVSKGGTQTVTSNVTTRLSFANEAFDTNNNFAACTTNCNSGAQTPTESRFTPNRPGKYLLTASAYCNGGSGFCQIDIYKNGVSQAVNWIPAISGNGDSTPAVTAIVDLNGVSDYAEAYITANGTSILSGRFQGTILGPQAGGGGGGGATQLSALTDVTLTNLAGRDYLRYDNATSKWVNVSESTVMSTTTMVSNWPDAITCVMSGGVSSILYLMGDYDLTEKYYGTTKYGNGDQSWIRFNSSSGAYSNHYGAGTFDCSTGAMSISQLYAAGRAFNFIGNAATSSGGLGDRITSGTHSVTANTVSGYISLSTGGTDWGYLGSGASFLPTLSANQVNSTNISATAIGINITSVPSTSLYVNGQIGGGFGAVHTSGVKDWNDISNARPGSGYTLLRGSDSSNSPIPGNVNYFHPFSFEHASKDGSGNLTQFAVPYGFETTLHAGMYLRGRYNGTWSGWFRIPVTTPSGTTGINTITPKAALDVVGTISASDAIQVGISSLSCASNISGAMRYNTTSDTLQVCTTSGWKSLVSGTVGGGGGAGNPAGNTGDIQFNTGGSFAADTGQLYWDASNNRLGIGTGAPSYPLDVNGVVQATSFFQSSDKVLKDNIAQIRSGLAVIDKLRPVTFDWKKDGRHAAGLIAQDVLKVIPTAVTSNTAGVYSVDYTQTIPYLIRAMQELKADNDTLKTYNEKLARENKAILKRLDELERRTGTRGH